MSKILDLAKEFKATSSKEAESINSELRSDLAKLKSDIHSELSAGRQSLQSDIQAHNRALTEALANSTQELQKKVYKNQAKMSWSLFVTWIWAVLALMILCLGLIGWSAFQSKTIATQSRQITEAKQTLSALPKGVTFVGQDGKKYIISKKISAPYKVGQGEFKGMMAVEIE